jgi:hypothetical protein
VDEFGYKPPSAIAPSGAMADAAGAGRAQQQLVWKSIRPSRPPRQSAETTTPGKRRSGSLCVRLTSLSRAAGACLARQQVCKSVRLFVIGIPPRLEMSPDPPCDASCCTCYASCRSSAASAQPERLQNQPLLALPLGTAIQRASSPRSVGRDGCHVWHALYSVSMV